MGVDVDQAGEDGRALQSGAFVAARLDGGDAIALDHNLVVVEHGPADRVEDTVGEENSTCHDRRLCEWCRRWDSNPHATKGTAF